MTAALAALDLILAKALYADSLQAIRPELNADGVLDLVDARHPLLVEQGTVVGIDVQLGGDFRVLVVTGPNTGGKTVTLKTIGLLTAMAACGLAIPADRGRLPVVRRIFADIGDEQSIAQSLSTFSSHLRNVVATLAEAERGDLALLDEVGAGTDPDEGAALAMAVLETLLERGVLAAATTHYPELKAFALNTPGVRNASMEFDANTLRPTFRLRLGLPGASNALAIAGRLGLDQKVLGRAAKRNLVDEARAALAEAESVRATASSPTPARVTVPIAIGAPVLVDGFAEPGTLLAIDDRGTADVAAGAVRLRVPASQLRPAPDSGVTPLRSDRPVVSGSASSVPLQLDIRGARAEEALAVLEPYLNDAAVAGVGRLRIVHGKGTGALRTAGRAALSEHPLVRMHEPAGPSERGDGATIVHLQA